MHYLSQSELCHCFKKNEPISDFYKIKKIDCFDLQIQCSFIHHMDDGWMQEKGILENPKV